MGRAIATSLAADGLTVVAIARTEADLIETANAAAGGSRIVPCVLDVADPAAVEAAFDELAEREGRVDVLVCSHGSTRAASARSTCRLRSSTGRWPSTCARRCTARSRPAA
jgi:NAD(P)-dependent dehydrogenase (short-subunit alcohol dehydrogenase family)